MLQDAELAQLHGRVDTLMCDATPAVVPLDLNGANGCTRWRAHELCSYLDNRMQNPASLPNPDALSTADIDCSGGTTAHPRRRGVRPGAYTPSRRSPSGSPRRVGP